MSSVRGLPTGLYVAPPAPGEAASAPTPALLTAPTGASQGIFHVSLTSLPATTLQKGEIVEFDGVPLIVTARAALDATTPRFVPVTSVDGTGIPQGIPAGATFVRHGLIRVGGTSNSETRINENTADNLSVVYDSQAGPVPWSEPKVLSKSWTLDRRGLFKPHDAGYALVATAASTGQELWVLRILPDETGAPYEHESGRAIVTGFSKDAPAEGLVSASWVFTGVGPLSSVRGVVSPPAGFGWAPPFSVQQLPDGSYSAADAVLPQVFPGQTYYVATDADGGNQSNDGLTPDTPLRDILTVLTTKTDYGRIMVKGGLYPRNRNWGLSPTRDVAIIGYDGTPILSAHEPPANLSWVLDAGGAYRATRAAVNSVWDASIVDAFGDYEQLTEVGSPAAAGSTPGSWHLAGSTIYVRTSDSRIPDASVRVMLDVPNGRHTDGTTLYLENLELHGANASGALLSNNPGAEQHKLYARNVKFKYVGGGNGLSVLGTDTVLLVDCEAARNMNDGFNYNPAGQPARILELNCIGRHNGIGSGDLNNNGSSAHDGCRIVRINGEYFSNVGPNVPDVNPATSSWNVGVTARDSLANTPGIFSDSDFLIEDGQMWLDDCVTGGSYYSVVAQGAATVRLFTRESSLGRTLGDVRKYDR